jgi:hypothetical protein
MDDLIGGRTAAICLNAKTSHLVYMFPRRLGTS